MALRALLTAGFFGIVLPLVAGSCMCPISKQLRDEAQKEKVTLGMVLENPAAYKGRIALWGGRIIKTTSIKDGTEMLVLETSLDFEGVPDGGKPTQGRFLARSPQFLDPAVYRDRKITLVGEVIGAEEKALGKTMYKYPVVMIKEFHLWESDYYQYPVTCFWCDHYWGPCSYGCGPYYHHEGDHDLDHHDGRGQQH
jgi:outer membrane lipoprotein